MFGINNKLRESCGLDLHVRMQYIDGAPRWGNLYRKTLKWNSKNYFLSQRQ